MSVRPATTDDENRLLVWRNDICVRRASRHGAFVTASDHLAWMTEVLADPDRHLLIAEVGGSPVGQVRFDRLAEEAFEISVSVAQRGRGLGSAAIVAGVRWLAEIESPTCLEAQVRGDNGVSLRAFEAAGFSFAQSTEDGYRRLILRLKGPDS